MKVTPIPIGQEGDLSADSDCLFPFGVGTVYHCFNQNMAFFLSILLVYKEV